MESILTSIKKLLGIAEDYKQYDADIVMYINSVFADLALIGVGPSDGFTIWDESAIWDDFVSDDTLLNSVKSYMFLRVKLLFDVNSIGASTLTSYEGQIKKWEWLLNVAAERNRAEGNT